MPKDNKQKIKLLYLMEILRQDTDEQHPISTNQICARLAEQGISCERRTVGMDMKVLNDYGYEIMTKMVGHEKAYYIDDRSFSVPEIKILKSSGKITDTGMAGFILFGGCCLVDKSCLTIL